MDIHDRNDDQWVYFCSMVLRFPMAKNVRKGNPVDYIALANQRLSARANLLQVPASQQLSRMVQIVAFLSRSSPMGNQRRLCGCLSPRYERGGHCGIRRLMDRIQRR